MIESAMVVAPDHLVNLPGVPDPPTLLPPAHDPQAGAAPLEDVKHNTPAPPVAVTATSPLLLLAYKTPFVLLSPPNLIVPPTTFKAIFVSAPVGCSIYTPYFVEVPFVELVPFAT